MPKKIRQLIKDLEANGFINHGGKGSHRKFIHPDYSLIVVISGKTGSDTKPYQEKAVKKAIKGVKNEK